jgi:hypothetical protein
MPKSLKMKYVKEEWYTREIWYGQEGGICSAMNWNWNLKLIYLVKKCSFGTKWYKKKTLLDSNPRPVSLKDLRLRPTFHYVHYFLIQIDLKIIVIFFMKNLGRCSYSRNFKQNRQFCKFLQSTENSGRSRKPYVLSCWATRQCLYMVLLISIFPVMVEKEGSHYDDGSIFLKFKM